MDYILDVSTSRYGLFGIDASIFPSDSELNTNCPAVVGSLRV